MNQNEADLGPLVVKTYKAKSIPRSYPYNIDYWLIGRGNEYVDAKRIAPIILLLAYFLPAWMLLESARDMEIFTYLFTSDTFTDQTRIDFILWRLKSYWEDGSYYFFIDGLLAPLFFFFSMHLIFSPYPRPVRFNQKNGLVYTKFMGKIWVTDWNVAAVKLWRGRNVLLPGDPYRGIQLCMHSLDRNGQLKTRWVMLSAVNSNKLDDIAIGGDPSLLYWHWLDEYMRGAIFEGELAPAGRPKKIIPTPKVGRLPILEKIMCFRGYKFSPKIDEQAVDMNKKLKTQGLYPHLKGDKLPDNPFFPWEHDFPERVIPNKEGIIGDAEIAEKEYQVRTAKEHKKAIRDSIIHDLHNRRVAVERVKELEPMVKEQGVTKSYRDYTLASLKKALASDCQKTPEELELIKLYIELGGYEAQR